jgi:hypothetical protein
MNLEGVAIIRSANSVTVVLSKLSEFTNQYLCVNVDYSQQKMNNGNLAYAANFKKITDFKSRRPFVVYSEEFLIEEFEKNGAFLDYNVALKVGDKVQFNGAKFYVIAIIINSYAQWNLPTPLLFNPKDMAKDLKMLYGSRFTDDEILIKINDNLEAGKYDSDFALPIIDSNLYFEEMSILNKTLSQAQIEELISKYKAKINQTYEVSKNVFIDTVFKNNVDEFDKIKEIDFDLFTKLQAVITNVNRVVNDRIEGKKVQRKKTEKAVEVEAKKEVDDLSFLDDIDNVLDISFLDDIDSIIN